MIIEDGEVAQRIDGEAARFRKTVLRLPGGPPRYLVRKRLPEGATRRVPLVLIHGFGQNRRAWHQDRRSFVNHLASRGFDVFNLELRGHGRSRRAGATAHEGIGGSVEGDLPRALDFIGSLTGSARSFLLGHSLGGVIAYAVATSQRARVAGVVSLAAPLRFGAGSAALSLLRRGLSSLAVAPSRSFPMAVVRAGLRRSAPLWDLPWLPAPLRAWAPGSMEPALRDEYLRTAFDRGSFGELRDLIDAHDALAGDWARCDVPALVIAGSRDLLAPAASVRAGYALHPGPDRTWAELPFGHGDIILGRHAPRDVWPLITRWLEARDARPVE